MKSLICLESYWCSSSGVRFANAMWLFDLNTIIINSTGVKESMRALPLANCVSFNHEITAWKYENDFFFWGTSLKEMWDLFDMYIFYVVLCTPFYFFWGSICFLFVFCGYCPFLLGFTFAVSSLCSFLSHVVIFMMNKHSDWLPKGSLRKITIYKPNSTTVLKLGVSKIYIIKI